MWPNFYFSSSFQHYVLHSALLALLSQSPYLITFLFSLTFQLTQALVSPVLKMLGHYCVAEAKGPHVEASSRYFDEHEIPEPMTNSSRAKVLEYLSKKGYNRTEAMLRVESATQDIEGRPLIPRAEDAGGAKYGKGFGMITRDTCSFIPLTDTISRTHAYLDRRKSGDLQGETYQFTES
jgi:hypothetical protein